jgi:NAD(P)-dependent dehydrogenase (short-subunit alcohol dehydrogenase family)
MDTTRHSGRIAIVTGAGNGIGRATALRLAHEGAAVTGCDISDEALRQSGEVFAAAGVEVALQKTDITAQDEVDALVAGVLASHGRVDILANVAGIMDWFLPAHEIDDETWRRVMGVNVDAIMRLCRAVLPGMMERKAGAIVNISSFGGLHGGAAGFSYTASKHAVVGMTRSIAWTYREEGIRCNAICPGSVETNIGTTAIPRSMWGFERLAKVHAAAAAPAQPDRIAALLSWLASDEASNVNGAIVADDGGWAAG